MGKSKKKKQKDFQKVKLKAGRRLKPADNVTNASFRTRSIQVAQQLKGSTSEPSTKRKQNISDLLSQCQHYNITVRHDALMGMRELLTSHPELLSSHLAAILEKTSELFTDKDAAVRQSVIKLLKQIFPIISVKHLSPFFPIFSAHLSCAMTHLHDDVQLDSLFVFDLLLEFFPELIVKSSSQLLPNFVDQISQKRTSGAGKTQNRSLLVNPGSKMSAQKWRVRVLERLQKLLVAMTSAKCREHSEMVTLSRSAHANVTWTDSTRLQYQPFPEGFRKGWSLAGMTLRKQSSEHQRGILSDTEQIQNLVKTLTPLLVDCWVESTPAVHGTNMAIVLSPEAVRTCVQILSVIQLLWQCVELHGKSQISWLAEQYCREFQTHFLVNFPYSMHETLGTKDKDKKGKPQKQVSVELLNFAVCDIMSSFLLSDTCGHNSPTWLSQLSDYLTAVMQGRELHVHSVSQHSKTIVKILERLTVAQIDEEILTGLLSEAINRFLTAHHNASEKNNYLKFFSDIVLDPKHQATVREDIVDKFLSSLPELLTLVAKDNQQMSAQVLSVMKHAAGQNRSSFLQALSGNLNKLLDTSLLLTLECHHQRSMFDLTYFLTEIDERHLKHLTHLTRQGELPKEVIIYLIQVLQHRILKNSIGIFSPVQLSQHLGFLLTVLIGSSTSEMEVWRQGEITTGCFGGFTLLYEGLKNWERVHSIVQTVCYCFDQFENTAQMVDIMSSFVNSILETHSTMSIQAAYGVVHMASSMEFWKQPISEALTSHLCKLCTSILNSVVSLELAANENVNYLTGKITLTNENKEMDVEANQNKVLLPPDFVTSACMKCLSCLPNGVQHLFTILMGVLNDSSNENDVCMVAKIVIKLLMLRTSEFPYLQSHLQSLSHTLISSTEIKFPGVVQNQWWTELTYLVEL